MKNLREIVRDAVCEAFEAYGYSATRAARALGVSRFTVYRYYRDARETAAWETRVGELWLEAQKTLRQDARCRVFRESGEPQ